jgi:CheY-like chemotaxis protein
MATVLVVDDSAMDRLLVGALLQEQVGLEPIYAEDGRQALDLMAAQTPDLVLTDLQMPEVNGLQLVEAIQRNYRHVPVILMTAHGSEEAAVQALLKGAASYVPKRNLARDLNETVDNILGMARSSPNHPLVWECLVQSQQQFVLNNDLARIPPLIGHLQDQLRQLSFCDQGGLFRVGTALYEALTNAVEHGNLEISSELRGAADRRPLLRLTEERRRQPPYRDRSVYVTSQLCPRQATFVIRDDGPGFDPAELPDPTDPATLERPTGRGLLLIRTFMDEVTFNETGNQITLTMRRQERR